MKSSAEKATAILSIYEEPVYTDKDDKYLEYEDALDKFRSIYEEVQYITSFNASVEQIDIDAVNLAKAELANKIYEVQNQLLTDTSLSIDEYLSLEVTLQDLRSEYDTISEEVAYYNSLYTYEVPLTELDQALLELGEKADEYSEAVRYGEIGDVSNVKVPLLGNYYISSYYGLRVDPLGSGGMDNHRGLDFASPTGTPIVALFAGTVTVSEYHWGMGNYVRIDHGNGIVSSYLHMSKTMVKVGDQVQQYEKIGEVGATGAWCTGPHLHLALTINGKFVDPYKLFEKDK